MNILLWKVPLKVFLFSFFSIFHFRFVCYLLREWCFSFCSFLFICAYVYTFFIVWLTEHAALSFTWNANAAYWWPKLTLKDVEVNESYGRKKHAENRERENANSQKIWWTVSKSIQRYKKHAKRSRQSFHNVLHVSHIGNGVVFVFMTDFRWCLPEMGIDTDSAKRIMHVSI